MGVRDASWQLCVERRGVCRYATEGEVRLSIVLPKSAPATWPQINFCEAVYHIASMWLWLSYRFGDAFVDRGSVKVLSCKFI